MKFRALYKYFRVGHLLNQKQSRSEPSLNSVILRATGFDDGSAIGRASEPGAVPAVRVQYAARCYRHRKEALGRAGKVNW